MQETPVQFLGWEDPLEGIGYPLQYSWASLVAQLVKNLPVMGKPGFDPWRRERLPTPVFWPREFHRLYIVHGVTKSRTWLNNFHFFFILFKYQKMKQFLILVVVIIFLFLGCLFFASRSIFHLCSCSVAKSHLLLGDLMDCSPLGSSDYGISQREYWSRLPFSSPGIFLTRDRTYVSCFGKNVLYHRATRETQCVSLTLFQNGM